MIGHFRRTAPILVISDDGSERINPQDRRTHACGRDGRRLYFVICAKMGCRHFCPLRPVDDGSCALSYISKEEKKADQHEKKKERAGKREQRAAKNEEEYQEEEEGEESDAS